MISSGLQQHGIMQIGMIVRESCPNNVYGVGGCGLVGVGGHECGWVGVGWWV